MNYYNKDIKFKFVILDYSYFIITNLILNLNII